MYNDVPHSGAHGAQDQNGAQSGAQSGARTHTHTHTHTHTWRVFCCLPTDTNASPTPLMYLGT